MIDLGRVDWTAVERELDDVGHARVRAVLSPTECRSVRGLWSAGRFRKEVDMERHRFGVGTYRYFDAPLPPLVRSVRIDLYRRLAPIANRWMEKLDERFRYPATHAAFRRACRKAGQSRPTPLLLRYTADGYNRLHQDLYGPVAFPLQAAIFLSRPDRDYEGGEFLLVENPPRAQSIGHAIRAEAGEMVIFPTAARPVQGKRGFFRVGVRHGASRILAGERTVLGIIFHDAK